ncbi:MAG: polysaccharide biosynthesis protein [Terriglobales bacterium]
MSRSFWAEVPASVLCAIGRAVERLPRWVFDRKVQIGIDAVLAVVSLFIAYQLRFDFEVTGKNLKIMCAWVPLVAVVRPLSLWLVTGYSGIWRYFNIGDSIRVLLGALPPTMMMLGLRLTLARSLWAAALPLTVVVIDYGVFLALSFTVRGMRRLLYEKARMPGKRLRTLILGNEHGLAVALRQVSLQPDVQVIGLLAADQQLHGLRIAGYSVTDGPAALPEKLASGTIDLVLIADADVETIGESVATAVEYGVEVRLLPSAADIIRGDVRVSAKPKPELALKHTANVEPAHPLVIDSFGDRVVLVTGAGGSIGAEISRQVARLPVASLVLLDQDENAIFEIEGELRGKVTPGLVALVGDIRDRARMRSVFQKYKPDVVLHAAAYKHVPVMEFNCAEAVLNNVVGTRTIAETAIEFGAERLLMVSTDKAVRPSSVMGASKRTAELLVQQLAGRQRGHGGRQTRCACVRFGNVLGSRGSVVPLFLRQIANGGPVTITDAEMTRYFITIPEAVQLVLQAAAIGSEAEIYMLDMGDPVKITELARKLIEMSGLRPGEDIEVRLVGKRPGEKIHEQLWTNATEVRRTNFSHLLQIVAPGPAPQFEDALAALEAAARAHDDDLVRACLNAMPINFTPGEGRAMSAAAAN